MSPNEYRKKKTEEISSFLLSVMSMHTLQEKPSGNPQSYLIKWQAMTK